ncbi:hypothetical protein C2845_PM03G04490 [Panicum miliaceum]|uniref:ATP-dependent RNA helicase Ski2/MTR4 C-terminal domain-containing protein n=1 Tax=Panicum miliaceum TaxID=4540 RepID=A0A3L6TCL5_PANMI|nr:hypothetical protein C2845_PM03G04490 [Panicum miliaceum]
MPLKIDGQSSIGIYVPKDLLPVEARENTLRKVEVLSRFAKDGIPLLDPAEDSKVQSKDFRKATRRIEALDGLFEKHDIRSSAHIQQKLKVLHVKQELSAKIKSIKKTMRSSTALAFKDELKARKQIQIDVESFVSSFRPDIMEAVYSWAKGSKFYQIMETTQVFEGSLIRAIRRLEEVLQPLILASKSIGETELEAKLERQSARSRGT